MHGILWCMLIWKENVVGSKLYFMLAWLRLLAIIEFNFSWRISSNMLLRFTVNMLFKVLCFFLVGDSSSRKKAGMLMDDENCDKIFGESWRRERKLIFDWLVKWKSLTYDLGLSCSLSFMWDFDFIIDLNDCERMNAFPS